MNFLKDKIKGAIIGHALGLPSEGKPSIPYTGILVPNIANSQFQGRRVFVLGQVSDDTEMAIVLIYSLKSTGRVYDKTNAITHYLEWANSGCPFMGKNTRALFKGVKTVKGYSHDTEIGLN